MIKYKELRFYQSSKVDVGVLLKSVFQPCKKGYLKFEGNYCYGKAER